MLTGSLGLNVFWGASFEQDVVVYQSDGVTSKNLSGFVGVCPIFTEFGDPSGLLAQFSVSVKSAADGVLTLSLGSGDLTGVYPTEARYRLDVVSGRTIYPCQEGFVEIEPYYLAIQTGYVPPSPTFQRETVPLDTGIMDMYIAFPEPFATTPSVGIGIIVPSGSGLLVANTSLPDPTGFHVITSAPVFVTGYFVDVFASV